MKLCRTCSSEKNECEFGKRKASKDGLASKCKDCQREYDKSRANDADRAAARRQYAKTQDGILAAQKARAKWAKENKGKIYESTKAYRKKYPKKCRAHEKVAYEIKRGNLTRKPCEICSEVKSVAHHDDYDKPLDIRWLCQAHHKQWHAKHGQAKNAV